MHTYLSLLRVVSTYTCRFVLKAASVKRLIFLAHFAFWSPCCWDWWTGNFYSAFPPMFSFGLSLPFCRNSRHASRHSTELLLDKKSANIRYLPNQWADLAANGLIRKRITFYVTIKRWKKNQKNQRRNQGQLLWRTMWKSVSRPP